MPKSTIDFALVRSGTVRRLESKHAWRDAFCGSDPAPISLDWWGKVTELRVNDKRIQAGRRNEEEIV